MAGCAVWFWNDEPPAGQFRLSPVNDSPVENFQRPFELLKASYPDMTYARIWHAYYLILSALDGISCGAPVFRAVSDR